MHRCIISLATNCNQEENLREARQRLGQILSDTSYTKELWTQPFRSKCTYLYLNQLAYAETSLSVNQLEETLKRIEMEMGRTAEDRQHGIVRIDLDLLLFDHERYHLHDWERPYIQELLRSQEV